MGTSDGSMLLAATRWSDEAVPLSEFVSKYPLPQVVKVTKGQYMNLGVPTLPNPSLNQTFFLCTDGRRLKVSAQCVKFKEGKRVVTVGPKLAVPESYPGWFEILSEEGRAVKYIDGVAELARRFPSSCLVRENVKGYVAKGGGEEGGLVTEKSRMIQAGEILILVGETNSSGAQIDRFSKISPSGTRFLRCFDSNGSSVYLSLEQKGKFSPVAKEDNISGVHTVKSLLENKRLPLMVRLVFGKPPSSGSKNFVPEMRLFASFEEECLIALPLQKDTNIVALPPTLSLKLQGARNGEMLSKMVEFARVEEKCKKLMTEVADRIHVFDTGSPKPEPIRIVIPNRRGVPLVRRSLSDPFGRIPNRRDATTSSAPLPTIGGERTDDRFYDEIDQIYDYVRGFAPLPQSVKLEFAGGEHINQGELAQDVKITPENSNKPPEPPPIETIPVRRLSEPSPPAPPEVIKRYSVDMDSRNKPVYVHVRPGNNKLYIKSSVTKQNKSRFLLRHSRSPPPLIKESPPQPFFPHPLAPGRTSINGGGGGNKPGTPSLLFNIRYKSLTNLTADFNNTLDSSMSGGRISAGSYLESSYLDPSKHGKKTTNKLNRPQSLTNLVWDLSQNNNGPSPTRALPAVMDKNKVNLISRALTKMDSKSKTDAYYSKGSNPFTNNLGTIYL